MKLTRARLHRECQELMSHPNIRIQERELPHAKANSEWDDNSILIRVDSDQGSRIESVVHELIHIVLEKWGLREQMNSTLEELLVVAWTKTVYRRCIDHKTKETAEMRWWRRAIEAKAE